MPCVNCDLDLGDTCMSMSQGHDTIAWYNIKIQLGSDNLWSGHSFGYVCTVIMTSEIWPWFKVMTHPWVMVNNCVKYYSDPTWQWGVMARTRISSMCALWPWPWRYDLGLRSWHTLGSWTTIVWNIIQIQFGSEELWPGHRFPVCVHCDLDLGSRPWHTLESWTTIVWNIIQIQSGSEELWPGHGFPVCVHCDLDLGDMTLGQGHNTPFGHGQQFSTSS